MKFLSSAGLAVGILAISGCSASGPLFREAEAPPTGKALVYLYRPSSFAMGGKTAQFLIDGQRVADLSNNGYTHLYLAAGRHKVQQRWTDSTLPALLAGPTETIELPLDTQTGDIYYVRFSTAATDFSFNGVSHTATLEWQLQQVPSAVSTTELSQTRYQPAR